MYDRSDWSPLRRSSCWMRLTHQYLSISTADDQVDSINAVEENTREVWKRRGLRKIGSGTCGSIWAPVNYNLVIKKERPHMFGDHRGLENDFAMHQRISEAFDYVETTLRLDVGVHVPRPIDYIPHHDEEWNSHKSLIQLEEKDTYRSDCITMEYIFPLPVPLREELIMRYCPEHLGEKASMDESNDDALIRPYLGQYHKYARSQDNMFLDLELETTMSSIARGMARALAILHWHVECDVNDVEFVLGSRPLSRHKDLQHSVSKNGINSKYQQVHLWLLDFNQVQPLTPHDGVNEAVKGFRNNDRYFPRPGRSPDWLWEEFKKKYRSFGNKILDDKGRIKSWYYKELRTCGGPEAFLAAIESTTLAANTKIERKEKQKTVMTKRGWLKKRHQMRLERIMRRKLAHE